MNEQIFIFREYMDADQVSMHIYFVRFARLNCRSILVFFLCLPRWIRFPGFA